MGLFELVGRESVVALRKLAAMAALSGLANALVLAVINGAASFAELPVVQFKYLVLFAIVLATYILAERYILVKSISTVESVLDQIRIRLAERIRAADLSPIEKIGRSSLYSCASKELIAISQAATAVIGAFQASLLVFFSLIYLAILSSAAFWITVSVTLLGVSIHFQRRQELVAGMRRSVEQENAFLDLFTQMLDGFKEMKLNRPLGDSLSAHVKASSASLTATKIAVSHTFSIQAIFSQAAFYVMIACIVFLLPKFHQTDSAMLTKATATILFIVGPLTALIGSIPVIAQANVAADNVAALEEQLYSAVECAVEPAPEPIRKASFQSLELDRIRFEYLASNGDTDFAVGPLDLHITPGEVLFLVGGNGSGKSTFLKLLTSLYLPRSGALRLDNRTVSAANLEEFRSLFGVIFADYHLFDRLYGLEHVEPAAIHVLLDRFELTGKVTYDGLRWSTTALSTGQRKRLALIVSLLDNRPIQVFDEWAADQDPAFRKYFYEELIPEMKRQGKTVIAATHDDRYFHVADRLVRMEAGQIRPEGVTPTV